MSGAAEANPPTPATPAVPGGSLRQVSGCSGMGR